MPFFFVIKPERCLHHFDNVKCDNLCRLQAMSLSLFPERVFTCSVFSFILLKSVFSFILSFNVFAFHDVRMSKNFASEVNQSSMFPISYSVFNLKLYLFKGVL